MRSFAYQAFRCGVFAALLAACGGDRDVVIETFDVYDTRDTAVRVDTTYEGEIALLVPKGDGYDVHDDAEVNLGRVVFRGVPSGVYYIAYRRPGQTPLFVEASESHSQVSDDHVGRQATPAAEGTAVSVSADFVAPWAASNQLELFSERAYMDRRGRASDATQQNAPVVNATSASDWTIPLDALSDPYGQFAPRVDAGEDDDLMVFVSELVAPNIALDPANPWRAFSYRTIMSAFDASGTTFIDGDVTPISGTFAPVPVREVTLDLRTSAFEDVLAGGVTDAPVRFRVYMEAHAEPVVGEDDLLVGHGGRLFAAATWPQSSDEGEGNFTHPPDIAQTISYGDPFGGGRLDMASVYVYALFAIADPVSGELEDIDVTYHVYRRLDVLADGAIAPTLGLPLDITVGDQVVPLGAALAGVGLTPRIRWNAPDGRVTSYALDITDTADIDVDGDVSLARVVARVETTATSFVVPEGLLVSGHDYYVRIAALDEDGDIASTFAQTVSGFFRP